MTFINALTDSPLFLEQLLKDVETFFDKYADVPVCKYKLDEEKPGDLLEFHLKNPPSDDVFSFTWSYFQRLFKYLPPKMIRELMPHADAQVLLDRQMLSLCSPFCDRETECVDFLQKENPTKWSEYDRIFKRHPLILFKAHGKLPQCSQLDSLKIDSLKYLFTLPHVTKISSDLQNSEVASKIYEFILGIKDDHMRFKLKWLYEEALCRNVPLSSFDLEFINLASLNSNIPMPAEFSFMIKDIDSTLSWNFRTSPFTRSPVNPKLFFKAITNSQYSPFLNLFKHLNPAMSPHRVELIRMFIDLVKDSDSRFPVEEYQQMMFSKSARFFPDDRLRTDKEEFSESVDYMLHSLVFREGCFCEFMVAEEHKNNQIALMMMEKRAAYLIALEAFALVYYADRMSDIYAARITSSGSVVSLFRNEHINRGWVLEHYSVLNDNGKEGPRSISLLLKHAFDTLIDFSRQVFKSKNGERGLLKRRIGAIAWWCVDQKKIKKAVLLKAVMDRSSIFDNDAMALVKVAFVNPNTLLVPTVDPFNQSSEEIFAYYKDFKQFLREHGSRFLWIYDYLPYTDQIENAINFEIDRTSLLAECMAKRSITRLLKMAQIIFERSFKEGKGVKHDKPGLYKALTICAANPGQVHNTTGLMMSVIGNDRKFDCFNVYCPPDALLHVLENFDRFISKDRLLQMAELLIERFRYVKQAEMIPKVVNQVIRIYAAQVMGDQKQVVAFAARHFSEHQYDKPVLSYYPFIIERGPVKVTSAHEDERKYLIFKHNVPFYLPMSFTNKDLYGLFCYKHPRCVLLVDGKLVPYTDDSITALEYKDLVIVFNYVTQ